MRISFIELFYLYQYKPTIWTILLYFIRHLMGRNVNVQSFATSTPITKPNGFIFVAVTGYTPQLKHGNEIYRNDQTKIEHMKSIALWQLRSKPTSITWVFKLWNWWNSEQKKNQLMLKHTTIQIGTIQAKYNEWSLFFFFYFYISS